MLSLERYEVVEELARGGMGVVYRARDRRTKRDVALKVLVELDRATAKRFLQEGQVLAQLRHPHLPVVHELGEEDGLPFLAMELVEGENLFFRLQRLGPPPVGWTLEALATIADTLDYCHGRGVIHRDVKLGNVMLERDSKRIVLVDFGLVRRDDAVMPLAELDSTRLSVTGEVVGTPAYMAPEQIVPRRFGAVGPHTDVYALGAALYELLTGEAPFQGTGSAAVVQAVLNDSPADPRSLSAKVPGPVAELCLRCLAKTPERRPGSAAEVARALRAARELAPPVEADDAPAGRPPGTALLGALTAVAVGLALVVAGVAWAKRGESPPASPASPASPVAATSPTESPPAAASSPALAVEPLIRAEARELLDSALDHFDAGRRARALALLEESVAVDATYAQGWNSLGYVRTFVDDFDGALADYSRALELDPHYAAALINRGAEFERRGLLAEALEDYDRALEIKAMPEGLVNRAAVLMRLGRFEPARDDATRAIEARPNFARAWDTRGWARRELGDLDGALADCLRAVELDPKDWLCLSHLGATHLTRGEFESAVAAYDELLRLNDQDPVAWHEKGKALYHMGRDADAVVALDRALELDPQRARVWLDRGTIRMRLGDGQGLLDYQEALVLEPDAEWAPSARETLRDALQRAQER